MYLAFKLTLNDFAKRLRHNQRNTNPVITKPIAKFMRLSIA